MAIDKIKKLKNSDNFLQISFTKGFKYIDTAGEILNMYADSMNAYNMDSQRLVIDKPTADIEELRISNVDFWCHTTRPSSMSETHSRLVASGFLNEAKKTLEITKPANLKRLGWRSYLLFENSNSHNLIKHGKAKTVELVKQASSEGDVSYRLTAKLLEKKDDETKTAILFDIDVFIEQDFILKNLPSQLERIRTFLLSRILLDEINSVLAGA